MGQQFIIVGFAVVQNIAQLVRPGEVNISQPNHPARLIAFKLGIAYDSWLALAHDIRHVKSLTVVEISKDSGDQDWDTFAVDTGPSFKVDTKVLF